MIDKDKIKDLKYEQALKELEGIIADMENESLELDILLKRFEVGKLLLDHCQELLNKAELQVHEIDQIKNTATDASETE
jgi:exodeoxyribonuclease VII small subunit